MLGTINCIEYPLKKIARGSQFIIYGNQDFAVKRYALKRNAFAPYGADRALESYQAAKQIPDMVLPFEIVPELECRLVRWRGWRVTPEKFKDAVVQTRVPDQSVLTNHLAEFARTQNFSAIQTVLHKVTIFVQEIICQGLYLPDPTPANLCLEGKSLKLLDCGKLQTDLNHVLYVLQNNPEARDHIENIFRGYGFLIYNMTNSPDSVADNAFDRLAKLIMAFKRRFLEIYVPSNIAKLWGTYRSMS